MGDLDVTTPYDELTELRSMLTVGEIAEITGLRRETLSRARPDSRFQRRTEKALADLYEVVVRLKPLLGGNDTHLAAVMRRPQALLGQRSIVELVREGKASAVLEHLADSKEREPSEEEELADFTLSPDVEAQLDARDEDDASRGPERDPEWSRRIAALLAADPELASRLPAIEAAVLEHFGPGARIERKIIEPYDVPDGQDQLYLRVHTELSFREEGNRLGSLLEQEHELLGPVIPRLAIGFLG